LSASPTFTGVPLSTTASPGTNTTQIATTAFVTAAVSGAGVSSFSGGTTGLLPNTATTGAIVLTGAVTNISPTPINTGFLYPVFLTSYAGGSSTTYVETDGSIMYNPSTNTLFGYNVEVDNILTLHKIQGYTSIHYGIEYDTRTAYSHTFKVNSSTVLVIASTGIEVSNISSTSGTLSLEATTINLKYSGVTKAQTQTLGFCVDSILSLTATNLVINGNGSSVILLQSSGTTMLKINPTGVSLDYIFSLNIGQPITINGDGNGLIYFQSTGTTIATVSSTGLTMAAGTSILSTAASLLTLDGATGIEFKSGGATKMGIDATGFYTDQIRNRTGVDLAINGNGSGIVDLQYNGNTRLKTNSGGVTMVGLLEFTGTAGINATTAGYNWYIASTQIGYFDTASSTGWRINASNNLILSSSNQVYIQGLPTGNPCVNVITNTSATGQNAFPAGWNTSGGAFVISNTKILNNTPAIGLAWSTTGNLGYFSCLEPNVSWRPIYFETGQANWYINGTLASYCNSAGWNNVSDARSKKDIKPLSTKNSLMKILQCRTTFYKRTIEEEHKDCAIPALQKDIDQVHIGLIAQEVNEFNPHCVSEWESKDKETRLGIQYNDFVIHLIGAVQEQQVQITAQQAKIEEQSKAINTLTESMKFISEHLVKLTTAFNDMVSGAKSPRVNI
jgi:hypothetical protein